MTSFDARLRLVGQTGLPLGVEIDVTGERMVVSKDLEVLADWFLEDITISTLPDGFHIDAEGEKVVLNVTDEKRFMIELQGRARSVSDTPG